ncbi:MAG: hypothetical protein NC098_02700 [Lachnoclostridium sp.]|nr:hypothetical protein [Lachnoclostridium sp.]
MAKEKHTIKQIDLTNPAEIRVNTRIDSKTGQISPTGDPKHMGRIRGSFLVRHHSGVIISEDDNVIYAYYERAGVTERVCDTEVSPSGGFNYPGGVFLTFGGSGIAALRLEIDDDGTSVTPVGEVDRLTAPGLRRVDDAAIIVSLPERPLKGFYTSRSSALQPEDAATLSADLTDAYETVHELAAARHRYVQPVIARLVARDVDGHEIYRSAPVMIAPAAGPQCTGIERRMTGEGYAIVNAASLSAIPFSIGIDFPTDMSQMWKTLALTLHVEVSPQLHAVDFDLPAGFRFSSFSATEARLNMTVPGIDVTASAKGIASVGTELRRRIEAVLDNFDQAKVNAFTLNLRSADLSSRVTGIYAAAVSDTRKQVTRLLSIASMAVTQADSSLVAISYPHTFSAACGAVSGEVVLWGDLTARLFPGYTAMEMAITTASLTSGTRPVTTIVELDDGRLLVNAGVVTGVLPEGFSPLLTYPHPRARRITILLGMKSFSAEMRPLPGGTMAYALTAGFTPAVPDTELDMHIVPAADEIRFSYPESVAATNVDELQMPGALTRCASGKVVEVTPASRGNASWDFARQRFYAFTRGGICTVTSSASISSLSVSIIDSRPVLSRNAVCDLDNGQAAIAGGDLIMIRGNKSDTLCSNVNAIEIGWNAEMRELWMVDYINAVTDIFNVDTADLFTRTDFCPYLMVSQGGRLLLLSAEGELTDASSEMSTDSKHIRLTFRTPLARAAAVTGLSVRMTGSHINGSIILAGDNGCYGTTSYRLVEYKIDGELNRPIEGRVYGFPFRWITFHIDAAVSTDTRLHSATFTI